MRQTQEVLRPEVTEIEPRIFSFSVHNAKCRWATGDVCYCVLSYFQHLEFFDLPTIHHYRNSTLLAYNLNQNNANHPSYVEP